MRRFALGLILLVSACSTPPPPLPAMKAGDETVEVWRDAYGIPHIFAKTQRGVFWMQGYTCAQDRMWQMETFRRAAKGEAAELFGKDSVSSDIDVRTSGYTEEERQKMFDGMSDRFKLIVQAYCDGVNAFIKEGKVPDMYAKLGATPRPWTPTDSIAIAIMMSRRFGDGGGYQLQIQQFFQMLEKKHGTEKASLILHDLFRDRDAAAPTTKHDHVKAETHKEGGWRRTGAPMDPAIYEDYRRLIDGAKLAREKMGVPTYFGSNAWVVSPKKSKTGNAMLYGGPMMGFRTPSICLEAHLVAEGLNVAGMAFPGTPGIAIGFNQSLAWTTTSGGADLTDIFTLELNDQGEYLYKGEWRKFEVIEEEVKVRGEEPRKIQVTRSVHGPVEGKIDAKNKRAHSAKMSFWKREPNTFEAVIDFNFARDLKEFQAGVRKIVTSHNFFVATKDGDIGFWFCGAHPRRKKDLDPRFPQKGDGSADWEGLLAFEEWPQSVNPAHGFFANWNNKPSRDWDPSPYGEIFWGKKIIEELESKEKLSFEDMQSIARKTAYHCFLADYFAPHLLACAQGCDDENVKKVVEMLSHWDHMEVDGDPRPQIVEKWGFALLRKVFGVDLDPMVFGVRDVERYLGDPLLYILEGEKSVVKLKYDFVHGRNLKELGLKTLKEVLKDGVEKLAWREREVDFKSAIGTVKSKSERGTYQMTVDVTRSGPRAVTLSAPGENEDSASPHHKDQVGYFGKWEYKPFVWSRNEMK